MKLDLMTSERLLLLLPYINQTGFDSSFLVISIRLSMLNPYSFIQSQFSVKGINTRQSGALLVMCSIQALSLISSFQTSFDRILLDVNGIRVLSVYLPPS